MKITKEKIIKKLEKLNDLLTSFEINGKEFIIFEADDFDKTLVEIKILVQKINKKRSKWNYLYSKPNA